jgi:Ca2+-transporting ATPase
MILFLCVAALFTAVQQEWFEVLVICLVMVLNASIGLWQTVKAERDVRSLARLTTPVAEVVREGRPRRISAVELVPGDTVLLESGDRIPADLRILHSASLRVDESMLTGEVLPVSKNTDPVPEDSGPGDRTSMAYSGTLVVSGRGRGVVVSTGEDTELGEIAALVQQDSGKTPLQILTDRLERNIGLALLVIATAVFLSGVLMGDPLGESFRTTVALVVSAMPEALPIVLSVAMGVGVSRMAARNAVVRNLPSVETLGSTQVIGSDKTGTLTMNRMTVQSVWTPGGGIRDLGIAAQDSEVGRPAPADEDTAVALSLRTGALTNEAAPHGEEETLLGDAVDVAMAEAALRAGVVDPAERADRPLRDMPYESENAYSQTVREQDGRLVLHVKGAPETVAGFCTRMLAGIEETDLDFRAVLEANDVMAADGLRVIATAHAVLDELPEMFPDPEGGADVARLPEPHDLVLTGLQGMMDPPRPGVKEAIAQCRGAGIHVLMITGDHPVTARAIARRLGLPDTSEPLTGRQLRDLDDAQLRERLRATAVAARMSPQDKLRIVERLKEDGQTVAVTGDGVNDAPALRAASIGLRHGPGRRQLRDHRGRGPAGQSHLLLDTEGHVLPALQRPGGHDRSGREHLHRAAIDLPAGHAAVHQRRHQRNPGRRALLREGRGRRARAGTTLTEGRRAVHPDVDEDPDHRGLDGSGDAAGVPDGARGGTDPRGVPHPGSDHHGDVQLLPGVQRPGGAALRVPDEPPRQSAAGGLRTDGTAAAVDSDGVGTCGRPDRAGTADRLTVAHVHPGRLERVADRRTREAGPARGGA